MIILAMTATGWLSLMVLIAGVCRSARLGDQAARLRDQGQ
jgi:hypothetical protein